jgi:hypothetical protein
MSTTRWPPILKDQLSLTGVSNELMVLLGYSLICFLVALRLFRYGERADC